jgi:L,D-peptidoglycan transpeptidase YkuD (ErfK/YbiS/YcfS/YnhG family)
MLRLLILAPFIAVGFSGRTPDVSASHALTPCAANGIAIVVSTRGRVLTLCGDGVAEATFPVALGVRGTGKTRAGDQRTPVGVYPLGPPRASRDYGVFVPVGYPTADQARAGFTGSAIGIHGPPRAFTRAGRLNTATDWTAGCIAVGSDDEVTRIAAWVRAHRPVSVRID